MDHKHVLAQLQPPVEGFPPATNPVWLRPIPLPKPVVMKRPPTPPSARPSIPSLTITVSDPTAHTSAEVAWSVTPDSPPPPPPPPLEEDDGPTSLKPGDAATSSGPATSAAPNAPVQEPLKKPLKRSSPMPGLERSSPFAGLKRSSLSTGIEINVHDISSTQELEQRYSPWIPKFPISGTVSMLDFVLSKLDDEKSTRVAFLTSVKQEPSTYKTIESIMVTDEKGMLDDCTTLSPVSFAWFSKDLSIVSLVRSIAFVSPRLHSGSVLFFEGLRFDASPNESQAMILLEYLRAAEANEVQFEWVTCQSDQFVLRHT